VLNIHVSLAHSAANYTFTNNAILVGNLCKNNVCRPADVRKSDCTILLKFGGLLHYGPRERLAGRAASSGYAALIATFAGIIRSFDDSEKA